MKDCCGNSQGGLHEFHCSWCPRASNESFNQLGKSSSIALKCTDNDHDNPGIWIQFGSVSNTIVDFFCPINFLHGTRNDFHRQKLGNFISNIEGRIEDDIPVRIELTVMYVLCGILITYHTAVPTNSCPVFFNGASMGSPSNPLATMPPANITSIVDSQQASGCFLEKA